MKKVGDRVMLLLRKHIPRLYGIFIAVPSWQIMSWKWDLKALVWILKQDTSWSRKAKRFKWLYRERFIVKIRENGRCLLAFITNDYTKGIDETMHGIELLLSEKRVEQSGLDITSRM
jgi:hypothetical protein